MGIAMAVHKIKLNIAQASLVRYNGNKTVDMLCVLVSLKYTSFISIRIIHGDPNKSIT